jgi:cob(I)alamin adenosyltransferase
VKIYTRTGDDGTTGWLGKGRISKHDPRVEAYGAIDELNAALGVARSAQAGGFDSEIETIQADLFTVGAELASVAGESGARPTGPRIADPDIARLEEWIDTLEAELTPLTQFIVPGGGPLGAQLHFARTVCRRAERRIVALSTAATVRGEILRYVNRLADLLFVMARAANARAGVPERTWSGRRADPGQA